MRPALGDLHPSTTAIVGLVLSHDPHGWHSPTRLRDLCHTDPALEALLGAKQPNVEFFLEDLLLRKDQDILGWEMDAVGKLTLLLLKHAKGSRPLRRKLKSWGDLFAEVRDQEPGALSTPTPRDGAFGQHGTSRFVARLRRAPAGIGDLRRLRATSVGRPALGRLPADPEPQRP